MEKVKEARVAVESFRPYYDHIMRYAFQRFQHLDNSKGSGSIGQRKEGKSSFNPIFDVESFCAWSGLTYREWDNLRTYMNRPNHVSSVPLDIVDKLMCAYGIPDQVCHLYLVTTSAGRGWGMAYTKYEREFCLAA